MLRKNWVNSETCDHEFEVVSLKEYSFGYRETSICELCKTRRIVSKNNAANGPITYLVEPLVLEQ